MPGIFISYRREDSPGHAGRIFDRLRSRFGSDIVFMDVTAIEAGVDFVDALHNAVGSCDALLAVIGPQWLSTTHQGKRRLDDPHDFVRLEIAAALERNVRVLPVLVDGASLPATGDLPADLQKLTRRQAVELRDARWDDDIERLVEGLEKFLQAGSPSRQPLTSQRATPSEIPPAASVKTSTWRGRVLAALAALILVIAAVAAWRGGLVPGRSSGTASDPRTGRLARADQTVVAPASSAVSAPGDRTALTTTAGSASTKPAESSPSPPSRVAASLPAATTPTGPAKAVAVPDVTGKTIPEAREILRNAGFRFLIRLSADRSRTPGIVERQALDESTGANQPRRVILTAVALSTVVVHVAEGNEREAESLVTYLEDQPSTTGSIVRSQSTVPRAEMAGRVAYSEERLAAQAEAIAKDVSAYVVRTGTRRPLQATMNPRVVRGTIIVGLYDHTR